MKTSQHSTAHAQAPPTLASWIAALALLAGPLAAQTDLPPVQSRTLENGLEVVVAPSGSVPLATIEIVVKNGAFTQLTPDEEGLPMGLHR